MEIKPENASAEFLQFGETGKKLQNYVKKVVFKPHKIRRCHGNVKNNRHAIDISKFSQKMNEELLKISTP